MTRDAHDHATLLALARTRRLQRALAHAYLHRGAPMPTLRASLGYMTTTACVANDDAPPPPLPARPRRGTEPGAEGGARGHRMHVLGVSRAEHVAYIVEELGEHDAPIVYRLWLGGPRQGHLVPLHGWYERADRADEIRARIAAIEPTLEPAMATTPERWMLSTRIIQRRALRVAGPGACSDLPIRKFALQLVIEPVSGHGPSGKTTVTAFLRPHAQLTDVWALPTGGAVARVTYVGIPSGLGLAKDTVVLLTAGLDDDLGPHV